MAKRFNVGDRVVPIPALFDDSWGRLNFTKNIVYVVKAIKTSLGVNWLIVSTEDGTVISEKWNPIYFDLVSERIMFTLEGMDEC